jgi:excisionase family DNA binding protein
MSSEHALPLKPADIERTGGEMPADWLTPRAAAKLIGVGQQLIYDACEGRGLRHTRLGGKNRIRIHREWLRSWMEAHAPTVRLSSTQIDGTDQTKT